MRRPYKVMVGTALLLAAGSMFLSALLFTRLDDQQRAIHNAQVEQRQGRATSLTATCATLSGVIEAGRATILGGVIIKPREFERNLERMGLPPRPTRKRSATSAAAAYANAIAARVETATGKHGLIRKDGTLDCALLRRIGHAR